MNTATDLYPSRVSTQERFLPRQDPVVWADPSQTPPIDRVLVDQYERDGFLVLDDIFTDEDIACFRQELDRLRTDPLIAARDETITEPGSHDVRSVFAVHKLSPVFRRLAEDARIAGLAQYLLNDRIYVHQSRVNYKPGFRGREFYWHSDFETWHVEDGMPRMRAMSVSIPLTDNTPHNGPLMLIPGSQREYITCVGETPEDNYKRSLKRQEVGVPSDSALQRMADRGGVRSTEGRAGSVILFDCNTLHGSNSNITPDPRSNVFFVFNALSNQVGAPFGPQRPRPEYISARKHIEPLTPRRWHRSDYRSGF